VGEVGISGLPRPEGLIEVDTVLDIGAGLRPMGWYKPKYHACAEPYQPYAQRLSDAGYPVFLLPAMAMLTRSQPGDFDAIYLLDVIEHMERLEGEAVIRAALELKPKQIIVATPNGFYPQEGDAWGLGGEYWQRHRSGWTPADFPGWTISFYDNGANGGFVAVSP
jgi:hypothetical protein